MNYKLGERDSIYKWKLLHIDDDESEAKYFKTKKDAVWHLLTSTGFMLDNTQDDNYYDIEQQLAEWRKNRRKRNDQ